MDAIRPQPGPQEQFLTTPADVAFFGGAAGGGKSYGLLLETTRHITTVNGFGAVVFRRTSPQIRAEGGLWDTSKEIYPYLRGRERETLLDWTFPPHGNAITFGHLEHEGNIRDWDSSQIALIAFDQLESFYRTMFFYMLSRNRSTCGIAPYIRATYNPVPADDEVGGWLHEFVGWYLDDNGEYPDPAKAGIVRWFVNASDTLHWFESQAAAAAAFPGIPPKSFTFVPSSVFDNKILLAKDPGYLANLYALNPIDQERLLKANHKIRAKAGKVFNRDWFPIVDVAAAAQRIVRFWDFAATQRKHKLGAASASAKICLDIHGRYGILDVTEDWLGPAEVDNHAVAVARQDSSGVSQRWEEEGGSSGKRSTSTLAALMAGLDCGGVRPTGDKLDRSRGLAAQAKAGNVWLLRAEWNDRFLSHMHAIPDGARWDIHDAAAGAFNELTQPRLEMEGGDLADYRG